METKTSMILRNKGREEQQYNPENNVDYYNSAPIGSKPNSDTVTKRNAKNDNNKQRLPSFISHPNGIVLCVFKRQRSMIQTDQDQRRVCAKQRSPSSSVPSFICHPNGIVLRYLNPKLSQIQSSSCDIVISSDTSHTNGFTNNLSIVINNNSVIVSAVSYNTDSEPDGSYDSNTNTNTPSDTTSTAHKSLSYWQ